MKKAVPLILYSILISSFECLSATSDPKTFYPSRYVDYFTPIKVSDRIPDSLKKYAVETSAFLDEAKAKLISMDKHQLAFVVNSTPHRTMQHELSDSDKGYKRVFAGATGKDLKKVQFFFWAFKDLVSIWCETHRTDLTAELGFRYARANIIVYAMIAATANVKCPEECDSCLDGDLCSNTINVSGPLLKRIGKVDFPVDDALRHITNARKVYRTEVVFQSMLKQISIGHGHADPLNNKGMEHLRTKATEYCEQIRQQTLNHLKTKTEWLCHLSDRIKLCENEETALNIEMRHFSIPPEDLKRDAGPPRLGPRSRRIRRGILERRLQKKSKEQIRKIKSKDRDVEYSKTSCDKTFSRLSYASSLRERKKRKAAFQAIREKEDPKGYAEWIVRRIDEDPSGSTKSRKRRLHRKRKDTAKSVSTSEKEVKESESESEDEEAPILSHRPSEATPFTVELWLRSFSDLDLKVSKHVTRWQSASPDTVADWEGYKRLNEEARLHQIAAHIPIDVLKIIKDPLLDNYYVAHQKIHFSKKKKGKKRKESTDYYFNVTQILNGKTKHGLITVAINKETDCIYHLWFQPIEGWSLDDQRVGVAEASEKDSWETRSKMIPNFSKESQIILDYPDLDLQYIVHSGM